MNRINKGATKRYYYYDYGCPERKSEYHIDCFIYLNEYTYRYNIGFRVSVILEISWIDFSNEWKESSKGFKN